MSVHSWIVYICMINYKLLQNTLLPLLHLEILLHRGMAARELNWTVVNNIECRIFYSTFFVNVARQIISSRKILVPWNLLVSRKKQMTNRSSKMRKLNHPAPCSVKSCIGKIYFVPSRSRTYIFINLISRNRDRSPDEVFYAFWVSSFLLKNIGNLVEHLKGYIIFVSYTKRCTYSIER